ncbi:hypothetical protein PYCCODRAFT_823436 [Trametes coccinea BRFM310]|uniref:Uncharacterized protein n=1 Tax=Trametes coccinea (strain BRFM310) TaxID=1353009 RepID=A0A1Y2IAH6_TRAC3|nr:hypothetical protein PYCCODRAFT_1036968 [Trametes coccinea BRFM310]OSC99650.1 hypothetical protein PYCCODRAFT_823436 [Trametes coccinea BRFM310]
MRVLCPLRLCSGGQDSGSRDEMQQFLRCQWRDTSLPLVPAVRMTRDVGSRQNGAAQAWNMQAGMAVAARSLSVQASRCWNAIHTSEVYVRTGEDGLLA